MSSGTANYRLSLRGPADPGPLCAAVGAVPIKAPAKPIWVICARPPRLVPAGCRLRGRPGGLRTAARRVGWTQKRKTKDGVGRFCACYRDIRGQVQRASTFAKEREADKAVDVTRSVAYFHNANITQPRW